MLDVFSFVIKLIIDFINSLRSIKISGTIFSIFDYFIALIAISIIYSFILRFFRIESNILKTNQNKSYFKLRNKIVSRFNYSKINTTNDLQRISRKHS